MNLAEFNGMEHSAAREELLRCCGSPQWAEQMAALRPFATRAALLDAGDRIADTLSREEWLTAFACHPRIGDRLAAGWSATEQSGMATAGDTTVAALVSGNEEYEARFRHVFLICATNRSGDEMAAELQRRLTNDPDTELQEAIREHRAITALRLTKLVDA